MTETSARGSQEPAPNDTEQWNDLLDRLVAVRGVEAAAIVSVDGEFLQGRAFDDNLLERMVGTVTSALAAGEAMAGLLESAPGSSAAAAVVPNQSDATAGNDEVGGAQDDSGSSEARDGSDARDASDTGSAQHQLMVVYQDGGPILFTPLVGGECVAVVALNSSHDIGRVRFQLRNLASPGGRP